LRALAEKVKTIEKGQLQTRFHDPGFVDLFEDSIYQAVRALTQERIEHIASLVKNSLSDEQVEYIRYKHMLTLLGELNDVEVLVLQLHSLYPPESEKFREQHEVVLSEPVAYFGAPQDDIDKSIVHDSYKAHLVRLELLRPRFKKPKKGEFPEFDEKTGMIKAQGYDITSLGRLLLRHIDLAKAE
jgi:hypothetical protein